mgnify:CR=1 FL=1
MPRRQSFLSGAAILAGAVAVTKVLGALYKIPLGNLLDSQGMAHFYAAYNVYNLLLMLSTAGLPLAASRLVAQAEAMGRHSQARRVFRCALALLGVVGLVFSALMFLLPQTMAGALHDPMAAAAIRVLAPSVLCVCLTSAIRGYTQGLGNMTPTAVSQIIESACKLLVGLGLCAFLLRKGAAPETGAAGAIAGVTCGTALGLLFLLWALRRCPRESGGPLEPVGDTLGQLLRIGVPITVAGGAMSLMTLLDQSLVLGTLQARLGLSAEAAAELYGQYTFGMTLFVLPPSFIYPLTVSLIPAISQARTRHDDAAAARLTASALRITALLALPMGVGLSVLAGPILQLLYPAVPETAQAAAYHLTVLGIASVFVCLMVATNGILQANGRENIPIWTLLAGGALKIVTNYLMVGDPATGIRGAAVSTLYCYALIAVINLAAIARLVPERPGYISLFAKPVLLTAVMALAARSGYGVFCRLLPESWAVLPAVLLAAVVYVVLALAIGAVTRQDLQTLPKGEKLADRLHLR